MSGVLKAAASYAKTKRLNSLLICKKGVSVHREIRNEFAVVSPRHRFPTDGLTKLEDKEIFKKVLSYLVRGKDVTTAYNVSLLLRERLDARIFREIFFDSQWYLNFTSSDVNFKNKYLFRTITHVRKAIRDSRSILPNHPKMRIVEISPMYHNKRAAKTMKRFQLYVRTFIGRHGDSIWSLLYKSKQPRNDLTYQQLFYAVSKSPDIRALTVESYCFFCFEEPHKEDEKKLNALIVQRPFPHVTWLEYLRFNSHVSIVLCAEIVRANPQVKKLHISVKEDDNPKLQPLAALSLEGLHLEYFDKNSLRCLMQLGKHWPLKKLELHYCARLDRVEMRQLSHYLTSFSGSLEFLDLRGLHDLVDDGTLLCFPKLKVMKLKMNKRLTNVDFVIDLKNLQNLSIKIPLEKDHPWHSRREWNLFSSEDASEKFKFKGLLNNFHLSNSWVLLPNLMQVNLKKINVGSDLNLKYERNQYGIEKTIL